MKCLVLAAGYATRLYPLTEHFPKPLLEVGEKTILDWLLDDIDSTGLINEYIVVSNHKFVEQFRSWSKAHRLPITVLDDGTETNETRLGAVRDIQFAIEQRGLNEDLLVIAGDNVLDFSLSGFIRYAREKGTSCIMRYHEASTKKLCKAGVVEVDASDRVMSMEEKPAVPKSHWCAPPFYYYQKNDVKLVKTGIESGCGVDAPGSFISWLCGQVHVYAYEMPGNRYDIGNLKSYEEVKDDYHGITINK